MTAAVAYVASQVKRHVTGMRQLLERAIEDLQAEGVVRFTASELVGRASKELPEHGRGPAEIARLFKAVENMVTNKRLEPVDSRKVPGIKRPVSVYQAVDVCPLAGAELNASIQGWMQPHV